MIILEKIFLVPHNFHCSIGDEFVSYVGSIYVGSIYLRILNLELSVAISIVSG